MRRNQGFVLFSIAIALVLLVGIAWYAYVQHEASKQEMLQQAAQNFLQEHKDGRFPAPPTAAEIWAAQEQRGARSDPKPAGTAPQRPLNTGPSVQPRAAAAGPGAFGGNGGPLLSSALLLAALTALGFAGSTYRLAKQGGLIRLERDRLAQELDNLQAAGNHLAGNHPNGRPAPPWQQGALMMVRASTVPAIAYDLDARVLEVSEAFTRITGYTRIDIPDVKSWFTKVLRTPDAELEAALEAFRTKVHGGEIETRTIWTSSGETRMWLCQPLEVWPLEGDALLLVARATDVTAEAEAARAARTEAESLRAALHASNHPPDAAAEPRPPAAEPQSASARETDLAAQLARCDEECKRLQSQARTLNERLTAAQAETTALRAQETDLARRAEARASELQQGAVLLEAAYKAAASGLCLLDVDLETLRENERWQQMARDVGSVQGARDAITPLARETLRIRSATRSANVRVRSASGAERIWRVDCQPIVADAGAVTALAISAEDVSEQAGRMARLQEDAERLRVFAEHLEDGLWIADPRVPRLVYATPQAGKLRGRSLPRVLEDFSEWTAAVLEEDRERVRQAFFAAGVEGSYNAEYRVVRDDGSIVWLHDRAVAVHDAQNRLRYLVGVTSDVTVRRNAEDTMRSAAAILRTLVEHAPAMIWLKDAQGRYLYANREYAKVTGFAGEQLHGKTDFQVFPRAAAERMHENDARALAASSVQQFEETLQLGDGLHHFLALKFPARDSEAPAGALCGIALEISARRRSEDALRAEESRYRAIVASLPQALLIARENKIVYANAAAAELLGAAEASALVGTPLQQLAAGSGPALAQTAKILTAEEAGRRRFATRLKAGGERELEVDVSAAAYETATERAVQFVVQDIGERNAQIRSLQEAEAFFHGLCDAIPAALRLLDVGGRCNFASRGWEALGGSIADGDWLQRVNPDDRAGVRSAYAAPSRRDEPVYLEYRLGDGSGERWILDIVLPRFDAQGQWKGYLSTAVDISPRKRTEAALRAHADDLAALLDRCPAPIWVADSSGSRGYANQACLAWLGAKSEGIRGPDLGEHVHPEDRDEWLHTRQRHTNEGTRFDGIFRLRRFDDDYRHVHVTALPVAANGGDDTRFVGFLDDVTEFRRTAQALAVEEQRRSQIIALLSATHNDELGQVRHTAELVRVMFPEEPKLQQVSATVLEEAQRLEKLVEEMLVPLRAQGAAGAG